MRRFFDTSVLIPVFYADHVQHNTSTRLFTASGHENFCALRTLGEVYATLTGLPLRPRITGREALKVVSQIRERLSIIFLTELEYFSALERISKFGIVGAATYDMLIAQCALKAGADILLTWNVRDFVRFGSDVADLVKTPDEA